MGDIIDINTREKLDPQTLEHNDPSPDTDELMRMIQDSTCNSSEWDPGIGCSRCDLCIHQVDLRPQWRKFIRYFCRSKLIDWGCARTERGEIPDPVTGETRYIVLSTDVLMLSDDRYPPCWEKNLKGNCTEFETPPLVVQGDLQESTE